MLSQLKIINFQSHRRTILKFHSNVNLFIGKSDGGKSAIKRLLYWLTFNRPSGDAFKSYWAKKISGSMLIDGVKIKRTKGANENIYMLGDREYKAFGQDVPDDIKKALNLSELNFQMQMDAPFLFSLSSGEVARYLNEIVNLDMIDSTMININKIGREEIQGLESLRNRKNNLKEDLKEYEWIGKIEELLINTENSERQIQKLKEKEINLKSLIEQYDQYQKELSEIKDYSRVEKKIKELEILQNKINENDRIKYQLMTMVDTIEEYQHESKETDLKLKSTEKQFKEEFPEICPLCGK